MGFQAALVVLFLCVATAKATAKATGMVTFEDGGFKMTCPEMGKWYKNGMEMEKNKESEDIHEKVTRGLYSCTYKENDKVEKTYYFYVRGKICENCWELDAYLFLVIILGDVAVTVILMIITYKCTKVKRSAKPTQTPKAPARSGGQAPPSGASPYEQLNPRTRSADPYSTVNRMG